MAMEDAVEVEVNNFWLRENWGEPIWRGLESIKLEEMGQDDPFRLKVPRLNHRYLLKRGNGIVKGKEENGALKFFKSLNLNSY